MAPLLGGRLDRAAIGPADHVTVGQRRDVGGQWDGSTAGEELVGQLLGGPNVDPLWQPLAEGLDDLAAGERGAIAGEPTGRSQRVGDPLDLACGRLGGDRAAGQRTWFELEAERASPAPPFGPERRGLDVVLLRAARVESGYLSCSRRALSALDQRPIDLGPPAAERPQHRLRNASYVGDPVSHGPPFDPDAARQLRAQMGLVEGSRRSSRGRTGRGRRVRSNARRSPWSCSPRARGCGAAGRPRGLIGGGTPRRRSRCR